MPSAVETDDEHDNDNDENNSVPETPGTPGDNDPPEIDENTIRIMISTDNHLGYAEDDPVRGNDSFAAMEEVLYLARHKYQADMVLLAGDLFHHNKPSRRTLIKTMDLFRRYCLGPEPVNIQIVSDQAANFRRGLVNYEDENYSVDLPVFSIHGNHDDPTREGGELYAALDILDTANLVNYVGRQEQVDKIEVSPILIRKGTTNVALYGLGSLRDERLNRMWRANKVSFLRPSSGGEDDTIAWFNMFALHQNRDLGRGTKNCVHESMIPEWMDLVCWGHEHECCIDPHESVVGTFRITQPGSSVATSLVAGEAERKQIGVLDIREQSFRLLPIPLTQVRTFVLGEVLLSQQRRLDPEDPRVEQKMTQLLEDKVRVLIHDAQEKRQELLKAARDAGNTVAIAISKNDGSAIDEEYDENGDKLTEQKKSPLSNSLEKPDEVLVRIRVEHSGFTTLNNQRFGAKFVGQVANLTDILLFYRKKASSATSDRLKKSKPLVPGELVNNGDGDEGGVNVLNIEDLVVGELESSDKNLELFNNKSMSSALESYVQKQIAQAIPETVTQLLDKQQRRLIKGGGASAADGEEKDGDADGDDDGDEVMLGNNDNMDEDDDDEAEEDDKPTKASRGRATKSQRATTTGNKRGGRTAASRRTAADDDDDFDDDEDEVEVVPAKRGGKTSRAKNGKPAAKKRKNYADTSSAEEDYNEDEEEEEEEEDEEEEEEVKVVSKRTQSRKAASSTAAKRRRNTPKYDDDDDNDDDDDDDIEVIEVKQSGPKKRRGGATASATTSARAASTRTPRTAAKTPRNNLSQSQLSFAPVSRRKKAAATPPASTRQKRGRYKDSSSDDDDNDGDFVPKSRSYELEDDWGTAKTDSYK